MSVAELKEKHAAATETMNNLRERLKQRRQQLLDTDGKKIEKSIFFFKLCWVIINEFFLASKIYLGFLFL